MYWKMGKWNETHIDRLGQNIISKEKEEKDLGVLIQNIWWHIHDAKKYTNGVALSG